MRLMEIAKFIIETIIMMTGGLAIFLGFVELIHMNMIYGVFLIAIGFLMFWLLSHIPQDKFPDDTT